VLREGAVQVRRRQPLAVALGEVLGAVREGVEHEQRAVREIARELGAHARPEAPPAGGGLGERRVRAEGIAEGGLLVGREVVVEGEEVGRVAHGVSPGWAG